VFHPQKLLSRQALIESKKEDDDPLLWDRDPHSISFFPLAFPLDLESITTRPFSGSCCLVSIRVGCYESRIIPAWRISHARSLLVNENRF
jgi:hypothetical protein